MALVFMCSTGDLQDAFMVEETVEEVYEKIQKVSSSEKHTFITLILERSYYDGDEESYFSDVIILNYNMILFVKP